MPDFNPFDMDLDGDVDSIDFLGFDYLLRHVLRPYQDEKEHDCTNSSLTVHACDDSHDDEVT